MRHPPARLAPIRARRAPRAAAQRGFLMVTAVVLIVVVALLLTVMIYFSVLGGQATVRHLGSKQALFIAGTGLERGVYVLLAPDPLLRLSCDAVTGNAGTTDVAFGDGRFTVTGGASFYSAAPATLRLAVGAGDVTIPVNGLAGYAAAGRVLIGREAVDYSEVEAADDAVCGGPGRAPCLAGAQRGRDGTPATAHAAGTPLGQYQCDLQSRGGVPDLASARGRRIVQQAVQQQEGWAIGVNGTILRWAGGPAGNPAWTAAASPVTVELRDLSLLSYAEGWAVGRAAGGAAERPLILYWNGATWSPRNSNLNINQDLFGVHCADSNDCWVVGTAGGNAAERPLILYWNGATWSPRNSNLNINQDLFGVHCADSNDCWAVGTAGGNAAERPLILYWNGAVWARRNSNLNINEDLNDVFCVAGNDCWAVGTRGTGTAQRPLILHWNGAAWATRNSNLNIREDMNGIYCIATNDCWAVGTAGNNVSQRPLILHWDGTTWVTRNSNLNINETLESVHCVHANDCWAVGTAGGSVAQRPLILHWDGAAWSTHNSNLNINQNLMAVGVVGARQHPQAAWREVYQ